MKSFGRLISVVLLLAVPALPAAAQERPKAEKKTNTMDALTLLKAGQASGVWPEGMVVRISACLGAAEKKASGAHVPEGLRETWEFTSNQVHRVVLDSQGGKMLYHRAETRPFDSKNICGELLAGKAIAIQARKGTGPEIGLVGTAYRLGSRSIEVEWHGETILGLRESRAADLDLYRESDARAFGALYERLANHARTAFRVKAAEAK